VFNFIWEEINAISESPLKSCGYKPYIVHMIDRVIACTFRCDKDHHPWRIGEQLHHEVLHHLELLEGGAARRQALISYSENFQLAL
jgi:hypothetical protein